MAGWYDLLANLEVYKGRTLERWAVNELCYRNMALDDAIQALHFMKKRQAETYTSGRYFTLETGEKVALIDCWNTPVEKCPQRVLESFLRDFIIPGAFEWMTNKLQSMS